MHLADSERSGPYNVPLHRGLDFHHQPSFVPVTVLDTEPQPIGRIKMKNTKSFTPERYGRCPRHLRSAK